MFFDALTIIRSGLLQFANEIVAPLMEYFNLYDLLYLFLAVYLSYRFILLPFIGWSPNMGSDTVKNNFQIEVRNHYYGATGLNAPNVARIEKKG